MSELGYLLLGWGLGVVSTVFGALVNHRLAMARDRQRRQWEEQQAARRRAEDRQDRAVHDMWRDAS